MTKYTYSIEFEKQPEGKKKRIIFLYTYPDGNLTVPIFFSDWYHDWYSDEKISDDKLLKISIKEYNIEYPDDRYDNNGVKLDKLTSKNITYKETFEASKTSIGISSADAFDGNIDTYYDVKIREWVDIVDEKDKFVIEPDKKSGLSNDEITQVKSSMDNFSSESEKLKKTINKLKSSSVTPPPVIIPEDFDQDGKFPFMTENQIMKRMMTMDCGTSPGIAGLNTPKVTEEQAHLIIYGKKPIYDFNGKILDNEKTNPECVDKTKTIADDFELKKKIKSLKEELKDSIMQIQYKASEISEAATMLGVKLVLAAGVFADALTTIPKPIITVAISALQGMLLDINAFVSKVMEVTPFLQVITYLGYLLPEVGMILTVFGLIMMPITLLNTVLGSISGMLSLKAVIMALIGGSISALSSLAQSRSKKTNTEIKNDYGYEPKGPDDVKSFLDKEKLKEINKGTQTDWNKIKKIDDWLAVISGVQQDLNTYNELMKSGKIVTDSQGKTTFVSNNISIESGVYTHWTTKYYDLPD